MLFGPTSEKSSKILGDNDDAISNNGEADADNDAGGTDADDNAGEGEKKKKKRKGHGRKPLSEFTGALRIVVLHQTLTSGDSCPEPGCKGKAYEVNKPSEELRFIGQAPILAIIYLLQRLRCNLCGKTFTASLPEGVEKDKKYDETAAAMLALLRYGYGLPLNRLAQLEGNLGIPLPPSNQWEAAANAVEAFAPVLKELERQAAQAEVVFIDDTNIKILQFEKEKHAKEKRGEDLGRTGTFTSGIVAKTSNDRQIALFFTGRQHAGENAGKVLSQREKDLDPAIQMCDALSRNTTHEFEVVLCNCMSHGRREFVKVNEDFPDECRYVIEILREVYKHDGEAREADMRAQERLEYHRRKSKRLMARLRLWMWQRFKKKLVEPNSGLGKAIQYMRKHWRKLTRFLFVPGAPLDNNRVERALKMAICHRKNSLFYKTENGARVGDIYMSLIETCRLAGVNAFDYLVEIQRNAAAVARDPASWMPWNYREALDCLKRVGGDPPTTEKTAS